MHPKIDSFVRVDLAKATDLAGERAADQLTHLDDLKAGQRTGLQVRWAHGVFFSQRLPPIP
jgi:hypothetical protein